MRVTIYYKYTSIIRKICNLSIYMISPPPKSTQKVDEDEYQALKSGEYQAVRRLVNLLEGGDTVKMGVDDVIDKCSAAMNLRVRGGGGWIMRFLGDSDT